MRKNLQKIGVAFVLLFLFTARLQAQIIKPGVTLGFNGVYSMPQGDFGKAFKFGVGGEIYGGVGWGKTFLIGTVGYRAYKEDVSLDAETLTYMPIKLGVKQFFLMKRIFIQGDAGIVRLKMGDESQSNFGYDIGAGVRLAGLELGLFYDGFKFKDAASSSNSLNVKAGYSFSF